MNMYAVDQVAWILAMEKQHQRDLKRSEEGYTIVATDLLSAFCVNLGRLFTWPKRTERQRDASSKLAMQM